METLIVIGVYLAAILLPTVLLELFVLRGLGERRLRVLWTSVGLNILTNPLLNIALYFVFYSLAATLIGEALVICIEAVGYRTAGRLKWKPAWIYSSLANGISFITGLVVQLVIMLIAELRY